VEFRHSNEISHIHIRKTFSHAKFWHQSFLETQLDLFGERNPKAFYNCTRWCEQVANQRVHYSRKVKELTDKLEEAKPVEVIGRSKTNTDNMGPPSRVASTRLQPVRFLT